MEEKILRPAAEQRYAAQLEALAKWDSCNPRPKGWKLSPKAVRLFILGSREPIEGVTIEKKYLGNDALVERCIITLAGNRGLMLVVSRVPPRPCFRSYCPLPSPAVPPIPSREPLVPPRI